MNRMVKKITIISFALAGLISPEKGMGVGEISPWYKTLEADILAGKACNKYGIFRKDSGKICKDFKDGAELYLFICAEELGAELKTTQCGKNLLARYGSDFAFAPDVEKHVIDSTKKGFSNLVWLVCQSQAPTKNKALQRAKDAACPKAVTPSTLTAAPKPQPLTPPSATTIPESLKVIPIETIVSKALVNLPERDKQAVENLEDRLERIEALKAGMRKAAEQTQLQGAEKVIQQPVGKLGVLPKLDATEKQANAALHELKVKLEVPNPPNQLSPGEVNQAEMSAKELEKLEDELITEGWEINDKNEILNYNPTTKKWEKTGLILNEQGKAVPAP